MGLPTGPSVTFLFTDIEGSTRLERDVGLAVWSETVARHDSLVRHAIETNDGVVVKTEGDAFFAAFARPDAAITAATAAQRAIASEPWPERAPLRVRMGLHLGIGRLRAGRAPEEPEDYVGIDVNYTARIAAVGNGGQIVVSDALAAALPADIGRLGGLGDVALVDAGLRAVKDFEEPTRLHRLVVPGAADDTRALRTLDIPSNLPGEVTALVGRDTEVALLSAALGESRIVTLTGPGGSGKTRLALGVARAVIDRFPHGGWFVDLAALRDPGLLDSAVAAALGVGETPGATMAEALATHLRGRTTLLVLDNLEQLLPAGAESVARLVRGAPDLRVIVTSRELLRIAGERGHAVPPLDGAAGVALFEDRARALRPDLVLTDETRQTVRAICERVGGLPLAIELAAARIRLLSPALILERLGRALDLAGSARDLPERQRTLRGAITWSHDLLSAAEQRLFRRVSVFAGGWTLEAAAAVADADGDLGLDLFDGLESLADKSLVRIDLPGSDDTSSDGEARFGLHPLLREYATERLDESGERAEVEARHAAVIAEIAEAAGRGILGSSGQASLHRLDQEDHNMRAATTWSLTTGVTDIGLRILGATWRWFQQRGRLREGRALLAELLARPASEDIRVRIAGLTAAGGLAYWSDDAVGARIAYDERLTLATATGDSHLMADAHYDLGFLAMLAQDRDQLRAEEQLALDLYTAAGDEAGAVRARQALVLGVFLSGDYAAARDLEEQNLEVFRASGSPFQVADSLTLLSAVYFKLGDVATSWARMLEGLESFAENDSASGLARAIGMAAIIQFEHGEPGFAARIAGAAYELVRDKGVMLAPVKVLHLPDPATTAVERLGAERARELLAEGGAIALPDVVEILRRVTVPVSAPRSVTFR